MTAFNVLAIDQQAPNAAGQFVTSLHETGFAVLHGHPILEDEIEGMYGAWARFFVR